MLLQTTSGRLFAAGWGADGQLGVDVAITLDPITGVMECVPLPSLPHAPRRIFAGSDMSFALCDDGLYAWGNAEWGQLGLGNTHPKIAHPTPVPLPNGLTPVDIVDVAVGGSFVLVLGRDGRVWGVGRACFDAPQPILQLAPVPCNWGPARMVAAGNAHAAYVRW